MYNAANKNRKILYISGLGHSGSTILDLSLGCHSKIVGLGELTNLIRAERKQFKDDKFIKILCSCGYDMSVCKFWSKACNVLSKYSSTQTSARCRAIIDFFYETYGNNKIMVDSSKRSDFYIDELRKFADLYVVFLVRDFRSWIYSRHSRHGTNMIYLSYKWLKDNLHIQKILKKGNYNYITVGYEEFALFPEIILRKICDFVGLPYESIMLIPGNSKSHIIRGNVARGDIDKRKGIFYDARWMSSKRMNLYGPLFFPLLNWNANNVYKNILIGRSKAFGTAQNDFVLFGDRQKEKMLGFLNEE